VAFRQFDPSIHRQVLTTYQDGIWIDVEQRKPKKWTSPITFSSTSEGHTKGLSMEPQRQTHHSVYESQSILIEFNMGVFTSLVLSLFWSWQFQSKWAEPHRTAQRPRQTQVHNPDVLWHSRCFPPSFCLSYDVSPQFGLSVEKEQFSACRATRDWATIWMASLLGTKRLLGALWGLGGAERERRTSC
jgi:hypothetical protein